MIRPLVQMSRRARVWAAVAAGSLLLITAPSPAHAAGEESGFIRAGHLAVGVGTADIWLTPYSGGDPMTVRGVDYQDITDYLDVPAGRYAVSVVPAGAGQDATPMISAAVTIDAGTATSVFAVGDKSEIRGRVFQDDLSAPPSGQAKVRVVSAAPKGETVSLALGAATEVAVDVAAGAASGYTAVAPRDYAASLTASGGLAVRDASLSLEAGGVYTVVVLPASDGSLAIEAIEDAGGAAQAPVGGVDTGAGGATLAVSADQPWTPLAGVLGCVLVLAAVGTRGLRRELAPRA